MPTSPSCDGSNVILGGSLRTRNSVTEVKESREVLALQLYSPLIRIRMIIKLMIIILIMLKMVIKMMSMMMGKMMRSKSPERCLPCRSTSL